MGKAVQLPVFDKRAPGLKDEHLQCYGCAHSAADTPYPSAPSGERPCSFCVRNRVLRKERAAPPSNYVKGFVPTWYDGTPPTKLPLDAYITADRMDEQRAWDKASHKIAAVVAEVGERAEVAQLILDNAIARLKALGFAPASGAVTFTALTARKL